MDGKYQDYAPKLSRLIQHFRDRLNVPTVPFVMGLLGDYLGREGFGQSATEFAQINAQIIAVATKQSNCYYVTGEQLLANADGIHINAQSQRLLGMRYFVAFSKERDVTVPLPEEAYAEQLLDKHEYTKNEKMYQLVAEFSQNKISFETFGERMTKLQQT